MKLSDVPELYKIYELVMTSGSKYKVNGVQRQAIINAQTQWADLPDGSSVNRSYVIEFKLDKEETRHNVLLHKTEIETALTVRGKIL